MSNDFETAVTALRAAGEPTRLRLLALLARAELTVGEICEVVGQSQPRWSARRAASDRLRAPVLPIADER